MERAEESDVSKITSFYITGKERTDKLKPGKPKQTDLKGRPAYRTGDGEGRDASLFNCTNPEPPLKNISNDGKNNLQI